MRIKLFIVSLYFVFSLQGQVIDNDGNIYDTVVIGNQVWLKQNLKSIHYSDGVLMDTTGIFVYNNDGNLGTLFGKLYKYSVVTRSQLGNPYIQGACPNSYRVPNDADWGTLEGNLGGSSIAATHLKDTILWQQTVVSDNSSGFSALPGGAWGSGNFGQLYTYAWFWTVGSGGNYVRYMSGGSAVGVHPNFQGWQDNNAISCRCMKDIPIGIKDNNFDALINIYPNPATDKIYIEQKNKGILVEELTLIDIYGTKHTISMNTKNEFDVSNLNSGMYILVLNTNKGFLRKKIIIQ